MSVSLPGSFGANSATDDSVERRETVYDAILSLLAARGWTQGREEAPNGALSLTGAVNVAVHNGSTIDVARVARIRGHLRELAMTASLLAWNDDPERLITDVVTLLEHCAVLHPFD